MDNTLPGNWIISELNVQGNYGFGAAMPGLPGIFIGKMKSAAWSLTAMGADIADIYHERVADGKYFFDGKWHPLETREEVIAVNGA